jgi:hypothetical protein
MIASVPPKRQGLPWRVPCIELIKKVYVAVNVTQAKIQAIRQIHTRLTG